MSGEFAEGWIQLTVTPKRGELGNLKSNSKTMASNFN